MVKLPTIATLVQVIGGPRGSAVGPTGPTGMQSTALAGAIGALGPTGRFGVTGPVGRDGVLAGFLGPSGATGPFGSIGPPGPTGNVGFFGIVPAERCRYFENTRGYSNISPYGNAMGCKFLYTPQTTNFTLYMMVMFTGLAEPPADRPTDWLEIRMSLGAGYLGAGPPPNAGDRGYGGAGSGGRTTTIYGPGQSIPFFFHTIFVFYRGYDNVNNVYYDYWPQYWFDLNANLGSSQSFAPSGGQIRNISFTLIEF